MLDLERIRNSVVGEGVSIETVFGTRPLVYADYIASGRALSFVEDFISKSVLPYYANTHSETSFTGRQTTALREQARREIRGATNASGNHAVIFCGSGATAAIDKLISMLNLRIPHELDERHDLSAAIPDNQRPVVFTGPYEHHSNELPWRESIATVVAVPLCPDGLLDLSCLDTALQEYADRPLKIGSFSAASNVTGIKTDVAAVSRLLHHHGALGFWDYAAAAPYVAIDIQGSGRPGNGELDAVFLSPHKFIGGPGTPGILIVRKDILHNRVPAVPGGGTVKFVSPDDHVYEDDIEQREEGGTPAIVESIRAGLVFRVQQEVGTELIREHEDDFIRWAIRRWSAHSAIDILGNHEADRLSIASLRITWQNKKLHYGFVVALLNDLFGIQARGGCSCAGPYGHTLLELSNETSLALETEILRGNTILRPGWTRLNFNYFIDEETFEYLLRAVELIAEHGWHLLPYYDYDDEHADWRYQGQQTALPTNLDDFLDDSPDGLSYADEDSDPTDYPRLLREAEQEMTRYRESGSRYSIVLDEGAAELAWFVLPQEAAAALLETAA